MNKRNAIAGAILGVGLLGSPVLASAQPVPEIRACVNNSSGTMKIVGPSAACEVGWSLLVWNQQGPPGKDGKDGLNGKDGKDGLNGTNGTNGVDGKDGADGVDGVDGAQGPPGEPIPGAFVILPFVGSYDCPLPTVPVALTPPGWLSLIPLPGAPVLGPWFGAGAQLLICYNPPT